MNLTDFLSLSDELRDQVVNIKKMKRLFRLLYYNTVLFVQIMCKDLGVASFPVCNDTLIKRYIHLSSFFPTFFLFHD